MLRHVVTTCQLWCWFQQGRYDIRTLMKCVGKVLIYHPPKSQQSTMIWHCYSLSWMLWGAWMHSVEIEMELPDQFCWSLYNIRMLREMCMNWLQNMTISSSITTLIVHELIAEHDHIFNHHYSDLRIASPPDMHVAKRVCMRKWREPQGFLLPFIGSWCYWSWRPSPILAWSSTHSCRLPALRTCTVHSWLALRNGELPRVFLQPVGGSSCDWSVRPSPILTQCVVGFAWASISS